MIVVLGICSFLGSARLDKKTFAGGTRLDLTVMERTREIGIRRATGARRKDIFLQFLAEPLTLASVFGVVMGLATVPIASKWTGSVTPASVILALLVAFLVGLVLEQPRRSVRHG